MNRSERARVTAEMHAAAYLRRLPKRLRGLPMRLEVPGECGRPARPRGPLSPLESALYALHRAHHLEAHSDYDAGWVRPAPELAEAWVGRLALRPETFVMQHEWLRPGERAALLTTAAQAAVIVLAAGIAVARNPYVVWRGDDHRSRLRPVWLTRNLVFERLAVAWSDHFRQSAASHVTDLREETLRACRRDLVRNRLRFEELWELARNNPLYWANRQATADGDYDGGYTVRLKDQALVTTFVEDLEASGFRLREHGRRLLLEGKRSPDVGPWPPRQEIAGERPYNVVQVGPRSTSLIKTLEQARLRLHTKIFANDIRAFQIEADGLAEHIGRTHGFDPRAVRTRADRQDRQDALERLDTNRRAEACRDLEAFECSAKPAVQWAAAAEQLSGLPEVVTIKSRFERVINRRWEAVHLWPSDAPEVYRARWFSASDGTPLYGLDVSASQTQILAVFLGLRDLEQLAGSTAPRFNARLAELAWTEHRDKLCEGYTGKDDLRLIALVKTLWMRVLYGKPARYVAADQREARGSYGPGWTGKTDDERGQNAGRFLAAVPSYQRISRFLKVCQGIARTAYERDRYQGVIFMDPFDGAEVRWNPIERHKKVIHGLLLMLPRGEQVGVEPLAGRQVPGLVRFATPNGAGDYPVDLDALRKKVAPFLVHMLDAFFAGLVIEGLARAGVRDLVSIHDCWLVPQAHADTLARCIAEAGRPWLEGLGGLYETLIGYLVGTQHEAFARQIKASWEARVARAEWPNFAVKPAEVNAGQRPAA